MRKNALAAVLPCGSIEERPAEDAAEMVRIVKTEGDGVMALLEGRAGVHVPFEFIVVDPPDRLLLTPGDEVSIHIKPAFIEEAWKHHMQAGGGRAMFIL